MLGYIKRSSPQSEDTFKTVKERKIFISSINPSVFLTLNNRDNERYEGGEKGEGGEEECLFSLICEKGESPP